MGGLTESFPDYYEVRRGRESRAAGARALARSRVSSLSTWRGIQVLGIPRARRCRDQAELPQGAWRARPAAARAHRARARAARQSLWNTGRARSRRASLRNPRAPRARLTRARRRAPPPPLARAPPPVAPARDEVAPGQEPGQRRGGVDQVPARRRGVRYVLSDKEKKAIYDRTGTRRCATASPTAPAARRAAGRTRATRPRSSRRSSARRTRAPTLGLATRCRSRRGCGDRARSAEPIVKELDCTLEELYNGCTKKFTITRKRYSAESPGERAGRREGARHQHQARLEEGHQGHVRVRGRRGRQRRARRHRLRRLARSRTPRSRARAPTSSTPRTSTSSTRSSAARSPCRRSTAAAVHPVPRGREPGLREAHRGRGHAALEDAGEARHAEDPLQAQLASTLAQKVKEAPAPAAHAAGLPFFTAAFHHPARPPAARRGVESDALGGGPRAHPGRPRGSRASPSATRDLGSAGRRWCGAGCGLPLLILKE